MQKIASTLQKFSKNKVMLPPVCANFVVMMDSFKINTKQLKLYLQLTIVCTIVVLMVVQLVSSLTNDWVQHQAGLSLPDLASTSTLSYDLEQLYTVHSIIEKAMSDLSNKIETLQLQERLS